MLRKWRVHLRINPTCIFRGRALSGDINYVCHLDMETIHLGALFDAYTVPWHYIEKTIPAVVRVITTCQATKIVACYSLQKHKLADNIRKG